MKCPKCGFSQETREDCMKCGIIFAKFNKPRKLEKKIDTEVTNGKNARAAPLIKCRHCGSLTSKREDKCTKCGGPIGLSEYAKRKRWKDRYITGPIVGAILFGVLLFSVYNLYLAFTEGKVYAMDPYDNRTFWTLEGAPFLFFIDVVFYSILPFSLLFFASFISTSVLSGFPREILKSTGPRPSSASAPTSEGLPNQTRSQTH